MHSRGEGIRLPSREGERHLLRPARSVGPPHTAGERCARLPNRGKGDIVHGGGKVSVVPRRERGATTCVRKEKGIPAMLGGERRRPSPPAEREECPPLPTGGAVIEREEGLIGPGRVQRDGRPIALDGKRDGCARQKGAAAPGKGGEGSGEKSPTKRERFCVFCKSVFLKGMNKLEIL